MAPTRALFGLLGPLQMSVEGTSVALGGPKQRVVLACLLMNRNRPVAIDSLIAAAWEEEPPAEARANIHVYVSNLRRLFATAGAQARVALEKCAPGYQLSVDETDVDLGRFLQHSHEGVQAAAGRRFEEASRYLSAALAEWRGPVLEDLRQFTFAEAFAVGLMEHKVVAHTARAQAEIACGRAESVISEMETLVAEHPYREPVWAQLMTAYYLAGRQSDALEAYQRCKVTLADELGIDPNATLRDLHTRMLRQEQLDVKVSAQETAYETIARSVPRDGGGSSSRSSAWLQSTAGHRHAVTEVATSIGRLSDNHIVLTDANVSRRHAVIVDTGAGYVIHDADSANGIDVNGHRIVGSATLADGDLVRIGHDDFTFQVHAEGDEQPATT